MVCCLLFVCSRGPFTWCIRNEMIRRRYNAIPPNGNNANHALSVVECGGGDVRVRMLNNGQVARVTNVRVSVREDECLKTRAIHGLKELETHDSLCLRKYPYLVHHDHFSNIALAPFDRIKHRILAGSWTCSESNYVLRSHSVLR